MRPIKVSALARSRAVVYEVRARDCPQELAHCGLPRIGGDPVGDRLARHPFGLEQAHAHKQAEELALGRAAQQARPQQAAGGRGERIQAMAVAGEDVAGDTAE